MKGVKGKCGCGVTYSDIICKIDAPQPSGSGGLFNNSGRDRGETGGICRRVCRIFHRGGGNG